jgi:hypothetical protein
MGGGVTIFGFFERGILTAYPRYSLAPILSAGHFAIVEGTRRCADCSSLQTG